MDIKTKFSIGDLIQSKYAANEIKEGTKNTDERFEVINVLTETCSAGTQVHYVCRAVIVVFKRKWSDEVEEKEKEYRIATGYIKHGEQGPKFREDEIVEASDQFKQMVAEYSGSPAKTE